MDLDTLPPIFNFKQAEKVLKAGYVIKHTHWMKNRYVHLDDFVLYDQEGEEIGWNVLVSEKQELFELVYDLEEESCKEESITQEDGEHLNKLKEEGKQIENEKDPLNISRSENSSSGIIIRETNPLLMNEEKKTINAIDKSESNKENNGVKTTRFNSSEPNVSITPKTKANNCEKSLPTEENSIQPLDCTPIYNELKTERFNSVKLLNDSAAQLVKLANDLTAPKTDDDGKATHTPPTYNIDVAVKCLTEARNSMKTKLEYMKFAKELADDQA